LFYKTITYTVKPVYKGHSREPDNNVAFMVSCPLYTGQNCMRY